MYTYYAFVYKLRFLSGFNQMKYHTMGIIIIIIIIN